ncbi:hypothetical protein DFH27DRAFT_609816 [Peziza echinospora]|nr:hypothetical protein DFH27DRAFT_609816 [Peziza echinospora]
MPSSRPSEMHDKKEMTQAWARNLNCPLTDAIAPSGASSNPTNPPHSSNRADPDDSGIKSQRRGDQRWQEEEIVRLRGIIDSQARVIRSRGPSGGSTTSVTGGGVGIAGLAGRKYGNQNNRPITTNTTANPYLNTAPLRPSQIKRPPITSSTASSTTTASEPTTTSSTDSSSTHTVIHRPSIPRSTISSSSSSMMNPTKTFPKLDPKQPTSSSTMNYNPTRTIPRLDIHQRHTISTHSPEKSGPKRAPDGTLRRQHPMLGASATYRAASHTPRLAPPATLLRTVIIEEDDESDTSGDTATPATTTTTTAAKKAGEVGRYEDSVFSGWVSQEQERLVWGIVMLMGGPAEDCEDSKGAGVRRWNQGSPKRRGRGGSGRLTGGRERGGLRMGE